MKNKSLDILTQGFKTDFATYVFESEGFVDLMMECATDFIDEKIGVEDDEARLELAMKLMESISLGNF